MNAKGTACGFGRIISGGRSVSIAGESRLDFVFCGNSNRGWRDLISVIGGCWRRV